MTPDNNFKTVERIDGVEIRALNKFKDARGWLAEIFRHDELDEKIHPVMAYISATEPQVTRGPHEHHAQTDIFCFIADARFRLWLWDNRPASPTYRGMMTLDVSGAELHTVVIPPGVVHAYRNIGEGLGMVLNLPNQLYAGHGKRDKVDEIRHEQDPNSMFKLDD